MTEDADPQNPPPIPGELLDMVEQARYDLVQAIEALIAEVDEARTIPLSNSIAVGKDDFLQQLETAKADMAGALSRVLEDLPEELRAARWMVRERESYVARTNEKARELIARAKSKSDELISESYIVEEAVSEANALVRNAENEARRIRLEAEDRAERGLAEAEAILGQLLQDVRASRSQLHQSLPAAPEVPVSE